jgi:hypothetical protein
MGSRWTKDEEQYLIENYPLVGALECSVYLNRTRKAVFGKANKLGLKARGKLVTHEEYLKKLEDKNINIKPIENYISSSTKILHKCDKGHEISITPASLLFGTKCKKCYIEHQSRSHENYKESSPYEVLDDYINSYTKIRHKCGKGHIWEARPDTILRGGKCPRCNSLAGFDSNKPAVLYYIKVTYANLDYYKVGVTNRTIEERFRKDTWNSRIEIKILKETYYTVGLEAKQEESRILRQFKEHRQHIPELLLSGGNTELFEFDILGLDT